MKPNGINYTKKAQQNYDWLDSHLAGIAVWEEEAEKNLKELKKKIKSKNYDAAQRLLNKIEEEFFSGVDFCFDGENQVKMCAYFANQGRAFYDTPTIVLKCQAKLYQMRFYSYKIQQHFNKAVELCAGL